MSDEWKTIRVPKDVYDDAKVRKEEHGVTWGEYVNPHAWHSVFDEPKDPSDTVDFTEAEVEVSVTDIDALQERLDRIENAQAGTVSESLDLADNGIRDVLNRLDDLQTHLDSRFDELGGPKR